LLSRFRANLENAKTTEFVGLPEQFFCRKR